MHTMTDDDDYNNNDDNDEGDDDDDDDMYCTFWFTFSYTITNVPPKIIHPDNLSIYFVLVIWVD